MTYFSIACGFAAWWGLESAWIALAFGPVSRERRRNLSQAYQVCKQWPHRAPRTAMLLLELLGAIMCLAVGVMAVL